MKLIGLLFIAFLLHSRAIQAQTASILPPQIVKTDSILYYKDSVLLKIGSESSNPQLFLAHRLRKGQTLFQLADFYKVSVDILRKANPNLAGGTANSAGQTLLIPVTRGHLVRKKGRGFVRRAYARVYYTLPASQTLYNLAKNCLNIPVDSILGRNQVHTARVAPYSQLLVAWLPLDGVRVQTLADIALSDSLAAVEAANAPPPIPEDLRRALISSEKQREKFGEMGLIQRNVLQKGVAFWNKEDVRMVKNNVTFFALHNQAAIGSVIKVYNPMYKRVLYVKVIGRIPLSGYSPDVTVVLSPFAAKTLGAVDSRFHIEVTYLY